MSLMNMAMNGGHGGQQPDWHGILLHTLTGGGVPAPQGATPQAAAPMAPVQLPPDAHHNVIEVIRRHATGR